MKKSDMNLNGKYKKEDFLYQHDVHLESDELTLNYYKDYHARTQNFILTGCLIYSFFLFLFLIWTLINLWSRWNQLIEPVSSNGFDLRNFRQLIYPTITMCNIIPNVKLAHNKCMNYETDIKCEYKEEKIKLRKTSLKKNDNFASCLTYNYNLDDAFVATKLTMQDMLIISVNLGINQYPNNSLTSGVTISLHSQESLSEVDYSLMASPGELFLVRLKKTVNEYLNSTTIESFDGKISTLGDYNFEKNFGIKNDTVSLAFTYEDLNVMIVRELPPYDILTFLSETGGMLGLLLGTSLVNLIVFLLQWGWGLRLNEYNWISVQNKQEKGIENDNTFLLSDGSISFIKTPSHYPNHKVNLFDKYAII